MGFPVLGFGFPVSGVGDSLYVRLSGRGVGDSFREVTPVVRCPKSNGLDLDRASGGLSGGGLEASVLVDVSR